MCVSGVRVSISWFMRGIAMVQTFSTWVSPRWNRPLPWAVGEDGDLGAERAQVARTTTVDAQTLVDDPLADELLGQAADGLLDLLLATGEGAALAGELADRAAGDGVGGGVALGLEADRDGVRELVLDGAGDGLGDVLAVVEDCGEARAA